MGNRTANIHRAVHLRLRLSFATRPPAAIIANVSALIRRHRIIVTWLVSALE